MGVCISKVLLPYRPGSSQNGAKCIDVEPSVKRRSRSEMVNGSGQGTSRWMCV